MRKASGKKRRPQGKPVGRPKTIERRAVRLTKQPGDVITAKEVFSQIEKVAAEAGIAPEWVYAMRKTGMMVTDANMDQCSKKELAEWVGRRVPRSKAKATGLTAQGVTIWPVLSIAETLRLVRERMVAKMEAAAGTGDQH